MRDRKQWNRLDNAAKIFPPNSTRRDTKVFRFVCELTESVDPVILQNALEKTVAQFPLYRSILKQGLFWYYFEESDITPQVIEENIPPCSSIYNADRHGLLFRVLYYGRRINLEIYHALADGTGALQFLRTMVFVYLAQRYGISGKLTDYDASEDQKQQDAFYQYYNKDEAIPKVKKDRAYQIRGERLPAYRVGITEGFMPTKEVLKKSHAYGATLSEFFVTLLIRAIRDGMAVREQPRPVVVAVPVDLRRFFSTRTARNFFGVIHAVHQFHDDGEAMEDILANVKQSFRSQLIPENMSGIIGRYSAFENNPYVKAIPLQIKILCLRLAGWWAKGEDTTSFSNLGQVSMPPEAAEYIRAFSVFVSAGRPQVCLCSFGDTLAVSISSPMTDTGLQRRFFRMLTEMGISISIVSSLEQIDGGEGAYAAL